MTNLRTSSTDAASLFAAWPQTVEIVDRVTRPEARRLDEFLFPSGRDRHRTAWTEDDDAWLMALSSSGATSREIGRTMGRTRRSVLARLGFKRRQRRGRRA